MKKRRVSLLRVSLIVLVFGLLLAAPARVRGQDGPQPPVHEPGPGAGPVILPEIPPTPHPKPADAVAAADAPVAVVVETAPVGTSDHSRLTPAASGGAARNGMAAGRPVLDDPLAPAASWIYIWPPAADTYLWSDNPNSAYGSDTILWVDSADRSLVRWDLSSLPVRAMISQAYANLYLYGYGDETPMSISLAAVTNSWTEAGATWNSRDVSNSWATPGGDISSTLESITSVGIEGDVYAWPLTSLVAEWHSGKTSNNGIALQPYNNSNIRVFNSKENDGYKPELDVEYVTGPVALSANTPASWGVPSPDWYSYSQGALWNVVGIRASSGVDYDIQLFSDANYSSFLSSSAYGSGMVDFVLVDANHAAQTTYYPEVTQYGGRSAYQVEHASHTADLQLGSYGPYTMTPSNVVKVWDLWMDPGVAGTYYISVVPTSGDADLGFALFKSTSGNAATYYQGRPDYVALKDDYGAYSWESLAFSPSEADWYALVVFNDGSSANTNFNINVDTTPPSGSFSIANGAAYYNSTNVPLYSSGSDPETGIMGMYLQNSGGDWTYASYSSPYTWALTSGEGSKTVNFYFVNGATLLSSMYSDSITIDLTKPSGAASCPTPSTTATSFTVNWNGSDTGSSVVNSGVVNYDVQYRVGGGAWTDWPGYIATTTKTATFGPSSPVTVQKGQTYGFRARARDAAGNVTDYPANGNCTVSVAGKSYVPVVRKNYADIAPNCSAANNWCENNDDMATAFGPLGAGVNYTAYPDDANDYYYFTLSAGANVTVQVTNYAANGDLLLYDASNTMIGQWGQGGSSMTVTKSLGAGKYYIRVYTASGFTAGSLYTLRITK